MLVNYIRRCQSMSPPHPFLTEHLYNSLRTILNHLESYKAELRMWLMTSAGPLVTRMWSSSALIWSHREKYSISNLSNKSNKVILLQTYKVYPEMKCTFWGTVIILCHTPLMHTIRPRRCQLRTRRGRSRICWRTSWNAAEELLCSDRSTHRDGVEWAIRRTTL